MRKPSLVGLIETLFGVRIMASVVAASYPPATGKYQVLGWKPKAQWECFKQSVRAAGRVNVPIVWSHDGEILDGHHRWLAYQELKAEGVIIETPTAFTMAEMSELDKRHYAISSNCNRRHLSRSEIREIIKQELIFAPECADAWIAEICGVSDKTVTAVRGELEESISEFPTVKTFRKRDGKTYRRVFSTSTQSRNKAGAVLSSLDSEVGKTTSLGLAKRQKREETRAKVVAMKVEPLDPLNYQLLSCDFRDLTLESPVDLILTDPLYQQESLQDWVDLSAFAAKNLKDGGILVAYTGLYFLPQVLANLRDLDYVWTIAVLHSGEGTFVDPMQGRNLWRPVLVYKKGNAVIKGVPDTIVGSGSEKEWHNFQQPLPETKLLIEQFSKPGDLICDPFAGSFTTAVACYETGRKFIGCDLSADNVSIGNHRMKESAAANQADVA